MKRFVYRVAERNELDWLQRQNLKDMVCFDVGANIGYISCFLLNKISNRKTRLQGLLARLAPDGLSPLLLQFLEAAPRPVAEAIKRLDPPLYL